MLLFDGEKDNEMVAKNFLVSFRYHCNKCLVMYTANNATSLDKIATRVQFQLELAKAIIPTGP